MKPSFIFFPFTGWGKTSSPPDESSFADFLQEARMPVVDHATCAAGNADMYSRVDNETMLCAGYGGSSEVSDFICLFAVLCSLFYYI